MTLYFCNRPIKKSLFGDFENNFFNYPLNKIHHHFNCRGHCKNSHGTLEKQLSRALKNNELLKIVKFSSMISHNEDKKKYYIHPDLSEMKKNHILVHSGDKKSIYDSSKKLKENSNVEAKEKNNSKEKKKTTIKTIKSEENKNKK